jgi:hypothetical protein
MLMLMLKDSLSENPKSNDNLIDFDDQSTDVTTSESSYDESSSNESQKSLHDKLKKKFQKCNCNK